MNYKIIILSFSTLFGNKINSQWVQQTSPTSSKLEALYFLDSNTGFTSSSSVSQMYKTTNGGQTWSSIGNYPARDIWFADNTNGYATSAAGSPNGTMKKTTNAGTTWSQITPPNSSAYLGVFATSPTNAYFINTERKVLKTTNSGATLTSYSIPTNQSSNALTDIFFVNSNVGFISAQGGQIFKTTNAGASWTSLQASPTTLNSLYFVNTNIGYSAGSSGRVIKTIDGGVTWSDKSTGTTNSLNAIKFYDENNGIAVGLSGKIFRTNNGGDSWIIENSGTTSHLWNVFYLTSTSVIVVGDSGTILKNENVLSNDDFYINNDFKLYPNPVVDRTFLSINNFNSYNNLEIEFYDISGKLLKKDFIKSNSYIINKVDFTTGIYVLKIRDDIETLKEIKFIIE